MKLIEIVSPHTLAHRMEIRRMGEDVIPRDRSWQVLLLFSACMIGMAVLTARWWMCA